VLFGVGECEGRTPGAAENNPLVNFEMVAKCLNVGYQVPGSVCLEICVRGRVPATALVEEDRPVVRGIKICSTVKSMEYF
jgi:hypothetical protein